jgi:hypothetical protein
MKLFLVRVGWRRRRFFAVSAWQAAELAKRGGMRSRLFRLRVREIPAPFLSMESGEVLPPRPPLRREWLLICTNVQKEVAKEKG